MIIKLKDDTEIKVVFDGKRYKVEPIKYQAELDYYVDNPPVIAGTFVPDKVNWFVIADIFENHICIRNVKDVILEKGESIDELEYMEDVIY